jgi:hypothetical protein
MLRALLGLARTHCAYSFMADVSYV